VNQLYSAALEVQTLCRDRAWGFCFIGGLATLRWGEPRLTRDIDLTILSEFGREEPIVDDLLQRFSSRLRDAREFAIENRVVLLRASNAIPIDVALGGLDFERRTVERASEWQTGDALLLTCSAEDLIVHKVFAGRDRDWADVVGIIERQGDRLEQSLIFDELAPLVQVKGTEKDLDRLGRLLEAEG